MLLRINEEENIKKLGYQLTTIEKKIVHFISHFFKRISFILNFIFDIPLSQNNSCSLTSDNNFN